MTLGIEATSEKESTTRKILKKMKARDAKYLGEEPDLSLGVGKTEDDIKWQFAGAFNWYSHTCDSEKARQWIVQYAENSPSYSDEDIEAIKLSSDFTNTAGWIARIINRGIDEIPDKYTSYLDNIVKQMLEDGKSKIEAQKLKLVKLQEGRERAKRLQEMKKDELIGELIGELEEQVDLLFENKFKSKFNFASFFEQHKVTKEQNQEIKSSFENQIKELEEVLEGEDEQLVEAYDHLAPKEIKALLKFLRAIQDACDEWEAKAPKENEKTKKPRKPRKKKVKPASEIVKRVNYQQESKEFKLTSIEPTKIIGATQVWVFNTKYRNLGVYNSCDSSGISVKGSTLKNFDQNTSIEKKLRKPDSVLKSVMEGGKVALRKVLDPIKCKERRLTGRLNKDTIILRVL